VSGSGRPLTAGAEAETFKQTGHRAVPEVEEARELPLELRELEARVLPGKATPEALEMRALALLLLAFLPAVAVEVAALLGKAPVEETPETADQGLPTTLDSGRTLPTVAAAVVVVTLLADRVEPEAGVAEAEATAATPLRLE
jgi:hypothetical protein